MYGTVRYNNSTVQSQISFALTGLVARANHLFYRIRTVFRVPYVIRPWYESCARLVSPSDLVCQCPCVRFACALEVFEFYSKSFPHRSVITVYFLPKYIYDTRTQTFFIFSVIPNLLVMTYFGLIEAPNYCAQ